MKKIIKIILISIALFIVKTISTFIIEYYNIIATDVNYFYKDLSTGKISEVWKFYVAIEFIYGIGIYIIITSLYYYLSKKQVFLTFKRKFWMGFLLVMMCYIIYSFFENPIIKTAYVDSQVGSQINKAFFKGFVIYFFVGLSLPLFSRKVKLTSSA